MYKCNSVNQENKSDTVSPPTCHSIPRKSSQPIQSNVSHMYISICAAQGKLLAFLNNVISYSMSS